VALLERAGLPRDGLSPALADFIVAERDGGVVGAVGLEVYGSAALLRSAVVDPALRGTGLGARLIEQVLDHARLRGSRDVYLLTTTAERWFPRFGFTLVAREAVPAAVRGSVEFREACPASAAVMWKTLVPDGLGSASHPDHRRTVGP
jgi:amino-acid N-acetyltransferase